MSEAFDPALRKPRTRLRTRMTIFFLFAAAPAALIGAFAAVILDKLIAEEIRMRGRETFSAVERAIQSQEARVEDEVRRLADHDAIRRLASGVDHAAELERAEDLAATLIATTDLDLLAIGALSGPSEGLLISSAHLRDSVGDEIPSFLKKLRPEPQVGFAHELVAGNPPEMVPATIAVRTIPGEGDRPALLLYGGVRFDADFLEAIARVGGATLILVAEGREPKRFPASSAPDDSSRPASAVKLPALGDRSAENAEIRLRVDVSRLERAQQRFLWVSGGWLVCALAGALVAGAWLSRRVTEPIVELAQAAAAIGGGDLEVQVPSGGNDEVGVLVAAFNEMVGEIKDSRERLARAERVAAWREAARRIAHEIKNPLTPMQMAMETLRKAFRSRHKDVDSIVEESTKVVLDEIKSLSRMVSEFSEFARLPKPRLESVDPVELLDHASGLYGATPSGITIRFAKDKIRSRTLPPAQADRDQIARALTNLVKNAIEAIGSRGGTIELDAREARRSGRAGVLIEVRDDGPGMTEEVREKLFAPYFTTKPEGTGLGLSIVERIISEHEGAIDVESQIGAGTSFRIWLPAAPLAEAPVPGSLAS